MRKLLVLGCLLAACAAARASFLDRSVADWLADLNGGGKPAVRRGAAFALGRMGAAGAAALPHLARRVREDGDPAVRDMAAQAIGEIALALLSGRADEAWQSCGTVLLRAAKEDGDSRVRRSAVYALGAFSLPSAQSALEAALGDKSPDVRQNAAWGMGRLGAAIEPRSVRALRARLADDNPLVRRDAAQAFMNLGRFDRKAVADAGGPLFEMARGETDAVARKAALAALATVAGPEHADKAAGVMPLLESKEGDVARAAAFALAAVGGEHARRAMAVLRAALADPEPTVQSLAAAGLAGVGPAAAPAVEAIAQTLLKSKDPIVRRNCVIALGQIGPDAKDGVPAIAEVLEGATDSDEVRHYAAEALSHIKYPANEKAIPAARRAIAKDPSQDVRLRCVEALFQVRDPEVLDKYDLKDTLIKVMDEAGERSKLVRYNCARLLAAVYADRAPDRATEVLLVMLADREVKIFYETKAKIEGGATESSTGTTAIAARTGGSARFLAAEALAWMGSKSSGNKKVMAALKAATADTEAKLADTAKKSLETLAGPP